MASARSLAVPTTAGGRRDYSRILTEADKELAAALSQLVKSIAHSEHAKASAAWPAVAALLEELGSRRSPQRH